jgi:hypothetical protein
LTGEQALIARGVLGAVAGIATVVVASHPFPRRISNARFDRLILMAFAASRLGIFGLVFLLLRIPPRGDIPAYYWPEALSVLRGLLPYRDFPSSYAPLHPYLDALAILIWHSPLAIILLTIIVEAAMLWLWLRFGRGLLFEAEVRTAALLYLTSAISLQFVAIDGQNNVMIAAFMALSLLLATRQRELGSGAAIGTAVAAVKFLPLLYGPAFFFSLPRRWRWALGMAIPIVAVYGACAALRLPILMPLQNEGNVKGISDFPFLVESILGIDVPARICDLLLLAVLAGVFFLLVWAVRRRSPRVQLRGVIFSIASLTLALLLFSKKSWPNYLVLGLFPICLSIDARRRLELAGFALFSFVALMSDSYYMTLLRLPVPLVRQGFLAGQPTCLIFMALEVLLIAGYGWLLSLALQRMMRAAKFIPEEESAATSTDALENAAGRYLAG